MRTPLYTLLFACVFGCSNNKIEKTLTPETSQLKPAASETARPEPSAKVVADLPLFNQEKQLLYDPRKPPEKPLITKEESDALIDKLFTKRLHQGESCDHRERKSLEEDISAGQIRPQVLTKTSGAFTAQGLTQTLYVVDVNECNAMPTRIGAAGTVQWVIMTGDEITRREPAGFRADWVIPIDIDQNGTKEILAVSSARGFSGYVFGRLFVFPESLTTEGSGISLLDAFVPEAFQDSNCAESNNRKLSKRFEPGEKEGKKLSVWYLNPTEPGKLPVFIEEKFTATCEKDAPYRLAP
jgi:hypothetical protein